MNPSGIAIRVRTRAPLLSVLALLVAACVDWDEQEVTLEHDAANDRICAQLVYRGLFSTSKSQWPWFKGSGDDEDVDSTRKQLDELLAGKPLFVLFSPFCAIDLQELRESKEPLFAALGDRIELDHGDFFTDSEGRLCAWQHVRLRDVTGVLAIVNQLFARLAAIRDDASDFRESFGADDPESVRRWDAFVASGRPWFEQHEDGTLLLTIPMSDAAAQALARGIETAPPLERLVAAEEARKRPDPETEPPEDSGDPAATTAEPPSTVTRESIAKRGSAPSAAEWRAAFLRAAGMRAEPRAGGVEILLFEPGRSRVSLSLGNPWSDGKRHDLAPHLEQRRVKIRTDVTAATLRRDFADFRSH